MQLLNAARRRTAPRTKEEWFAWRFFDFPLVRNGSPHGGVVRLSGSGSKSSGQLAPADFAPLVHRNFCRQKKSALGPASHSGARGRIRADRPPATRSSATTHAATSSLRRIDSRPKTTAARTPANRSNSASTSAGFTFFPATLMTSEIRPTIRNPSPLALSRSSGTNWPCAEFFFVGLGKIAVPGRGASHLALGSPEHPARADPAPRRASVVPRNLARASAPLGRNKCRRIRTSHKTNGSAARISRGIVSLPPTAAARPRKCKAATSATPARLHLRECLIKDRHAGEDRRVCPREIVQDSARHAVPAQDQRHAASQQRGDQIAEAIGMREGDDGEIQVVRGDSHRLANLVAIGQKLLAAKTDSARRGRGA